MRALAIVVEDNRQSEEGFATLVESSKSVGNEFDVERFDAITPATVDEEMSRSGIVWNYPLEGQEHRMVYGWKLRLRAYKSRNILARMACFMSHFRLWQLAKTEPVLILEDDALFVRKFNPAQIITSTFGAVGINDPAGATRLPDKFDDVVQSYDTEIGRAPRIDVDEVPQGLAGASAYLMKPMGARLALELVSIAGAWPNDALLCWQLCPWLGVTRTYYTTIQGTPTTL